MAIHEYLIDLMDRRKKEAEEKQAAENEQAAKAEAARLAGWADFWAGIEPLVPEVLKPYLVKESTDNGVGYYNSARFEAPDLAPIKIKYRFVNDVWTLTNDLRELFSVETYEVHLSDREEGYRVRLDRWLNYSKLDDVLLAAYKSAAHRQALEEEAEQRNAERLAAQVEYRAAEVKQAEIDRGRELARAAEQTREGEQILALVSLIASDPVAKAMVAMFMSIQAERREWLERIEAMEGDGESTEMYYERKLREARDATKRAERETEDERRRASELEDERDSLKKLKRRGL